MLYYFFPVTLTCFPVIFHLFPIGLEEIKHYLQQDTLFWMLFVFKNKTENWEIKSENCCQGKNKCQGWRVEIKAIVKRVTVSREQSMSQQSVWGVIFTFNITEHIDALKTTTDETSLHQACVCFITQAARSLSFLTRKLPAKAAVMPFLKTNQHTQKTQLIYFFEESLGNLHALEGLATMRNFFPLLITDLSPQYRGACFSVSLSL